MNLIEKLGGYEKAKKLVDACKRYGRSDVEVPVNGGFIHIVADFLELDLLEYRRQHNIFEVGDDVVFNRGNVDLWVFSGASEVKPYDVKVSNKIVRHILLSKIRHATDAEIKAGRRLPVIESDDCSDIRNHISPNTVVIDHAT